MEKRSYCIKKDCEKIIMKQIGNCDYCGNTDHYLITIYLNIDDDIRLKYNRQDFINFINNYKPSILDKFYTKELCTFHCLKCNNKWIDYFHHGAWMEILEKQFRKGIERKGFCGYCIGIVEWDEKTKNEIGESHYCNKNNGIWSDCNILPQYYVHNSVCWIDNDKNRGDVN